MATIRDDPDTEPSRESRCAEISLADGGIVIYDTENHSAWIQSSDAVELEDVD